MTLAEIEPRIEEWLKTKIRDRETNNEEHLIESLFENANKAFQNKDKEENDKADNGDNDNASDSGSDDDNIIV